ncbi:hypothetical protein QZH41_003707 [Actinostola sp. cb2023]|nr:hypothetical protein QZH41_003707 [Actinostola sp. cb2023]
MEAAKQKTAEEIVKVLAFLYLQHMVVPFYINILSVLYLVYKLKPNRYSSKHHKQMRYVAAYLLASLGGNKKPSTKDIETILGSVGIEVDSERLEKVISELSGKNVNEIIEQGRGKLAIIPTGGAVASGAPAAAGSAAGAEETKEEKKEEAKKDESEESDDDMGFGLFD